MATLSKPFTQMEDEHSDEPAGTTFKCKEETDLQPDLQTDLQTTCNALAATTIKEDECFGDDFLLLFAISTGEDWNKLMYDCWREA